MSKFRFYTDQERIALMPYLQLKKHKEKKEFMDKFLKVHPHRTREGVSYQLVQMRKKASGALPKRVAEFPSTMLGIRGGKIERMSVTPEGEVNIYFRN